MRRRSADFLSLAEQEGVYRNMPKVDDKPQSKPLTEEDEKHLLDVLETERIFNLAVDRGSRGKPAARHPELLRGQRPHRIGQGIVVSGRGPASSAQPRAGSDQHLF